LNEDDESKIKLLKYLDENTKNLKDLSKQHSKIYMYRDIKCIESFDLIKNDIFDEKELLA